MHAFAHIRKEGDEVVAITIYTNALDLDLELGYCLRKVQPKDLKTSRHTLLLKTEKIITACAKEELDQDYTDLACDEEEKYLNP